MSEQQTLMHDPNHAGLWPSVRIGSTVDVDDVAWRAARDTHQFVGTCRVCGNLLRPGRPYAVGRVLWYPATCIADACGNEIAAHGPRPAAAEKKTKGKPA